MARTPDEVRTAKREHMARRRAADPQAVRDYQMRDYRANRDVRLAKMKAYQHRRFFWRRAIKVDGASALDLAALWKQRGERAP